MIPFYFINNEQSRKNVFKLLFCKSKKNHLSEICTLFLELLVSIQSCCVKYVIWFCYENGRRVVPVQMYDLVFLRIDSRAISYVLLTWPMYQRAVRYVTKYRDKKYS